MRTAWAAQVSAEGKVAEGRPQSRAQFEQSKTDESIVSDNKAAVCMLFLLSNMSAALQAGDSHFEDL